MLLFPQLLQKCENRTDNLWVKLSAIHHGLCICHFARGTVNNRVLHKDAGDSLQNGCSPLLAFASFVQLSAVRFLLEGPAERFKRSQVLYATHTTWEAGA